MPPSTSPVPSSTPGETSSKRAGAAGLVRDCHGDLRAEHVIVPERGDIYVYDCIEFNPELRQIDVAADIAFLVMDLTRLGAEPFGLRLVADYRARRRRPGRRCPAPLLRLLPRVGAGQGRLHPRAGAARRGPRARAGPRRGRRADAARPPLRLAVPRSRGARPLRRLGKRQDDRGPAGRGGERLGAPVLGRHAQAACRARSNRSRWRGAVFARAHARDLPRARDDGGTSARARSRSRRRRHLSRARGARCLSRRARRSVGSAAVRRVPCITTTLLARIRERELQPDRISDADATVVERQLADSSPSTRSPSDGGRSCRPRLPRRAGRRLEAILDGSLLPSTLGE